MQSLGNSTKIARPEERHKLILNTRLPGRHKGLEADECLVPGESQRLIVVKIFGRKRDIPQAILFDLLKQHAALVIIARMEKTEPIRRVSPDRAFRQETDSAIEIIVQVLKILRKLLVLNGKRLLGKRFGFLNHVPIPKHFLLLSNRRAR